jgi:hypothetical protein
VAQQPDVIGEEAAPLSLRARTNGAWWRGGSSIIVFSLRGVARRLILIWRIVGRTAAGSIGKTTQ